MTTKEILLKEQLEKISNNFDRSIELSECILASNKRWRNIWSVFVWLSFVWGMIMGILIAS